VSAALIAAGALARGARAAGALALFTARTARRVEAALPARGALRRRRRRAHPLRRARRRAAAPHGARPRRARAHFTHSLADRLAGDFRVVVMDRPGSGTRRRARAPRASPRAHAAPSPTSSARSASARRCSSGHSLGGAHRARRRPRAPRRGGGLALIAPLTHVEPEPPAVFRRLAVGSPLARWLVAWTVATPASILRRRQVLDALFSPDPVPADYATAGGGMLGLRPRGFVAASADLVAVNHDMPGLVERYGTLGVPVGVLFGTGDRILDYRVHGEALAAQVPGARLELVDGGHMLPLTMPDRAAAFVRDVARRAGAA
jgi:hypothetical protein